MNAIRSPFDGGRAVPVGNSDLDVLAQLRELEKEFFASECQHAAHAALAYDPDWDAQPARIEAERTKLTIGLMMFIGGFLAGMIVAAPLNWI